MILELHDNEIDNSLNAVIRNIDYMYQAEQWVIDTFKDHFHIVTWLLFSDSGIQIRAWKRNENNFVDVDIVGTMENPNIPVKADPRSLTS